MKRQKGFTLIELLVVIAIIAMLMAILMPALGRVRRMAQQLVCGTNLKGLGTACILYANDNDEDLPIAGGKGENTWSKSGTTGGWKNEDKDWSGDDEVTVGASLYLLVREADVAPKQFVCPSSDQFEFTGEDMDDDDDITDVFDFGNFSQSTQSSDMKKECPQNCVSYSYHFPYEFDNSSGATISYALTASSTSSMAVMSDRNPWCDPFLDTGTPDNQTYLSLVGQLGQGNQPTDDDWEDGFQKWEKLINNSNAHQRDGQNVLFIDGHASFEKRADCGSQNDNIFSPYRGQTGPWDQFQKRVGVDTPVGQSYGTLGNGGPRNSEDNLLVSDTRLNQQGL
ncbi:MAG: type II secretion system protein [Phycisphaerae bacterium]